jgi:hypothetical protein
MPDVMKNRSITYKNSLKLCYWNIGGMKTLNMNKIDDYAFFLQELQEYDVVI